MHLDIENGMVDFTEALSDQPFTIDHKAPVMSPEQPEPVLNDDTRRNIEKRYAALMGQATSKPDTEADEKALTAAQMKRKRKAEKRLAQAQTVSHAS